MTIRPATRDDIPRLVTMTRRFIAGSLYAHVLTDSPEAVAAVYTHLVDDASGGVFVAETEAGVVGLLALARTTSLFSGQRLAVEVAWWVEPEARGCGQALLKAGERWAVESGADQIQMVAPACADGQRVGRLYARRGYAPLETHYLAAVTPAMSALTVVDDVLPDLAAYRAQALRQPFGDLPAGPVVFHGFAPPPNDTVAQAITARWPTLTPTLSLLRQSPLWQVEPTYIHTDADMGDWTALLYLTADPPADDGTTFWREAATGARSYDPRVPAAAWTDLEAWEAWTTVAARPNRLVLFPAGYYHSRALVDNYGAGDTARLIQVTFGTGAVPLVGG